MKKFIFAALLSVLSVSCAFAAQNTDLVLENERWYGKFTAYVCDDGNTQALEVPAEFADYNVTFAHIGTDYSLDNFVMTATFEENGTKCNYSALLLADNAAWTIALTESKAYATEGTGSCGAGQAMIDEVLAFNNYKYLHGRAAIYFPFSNSITACVDGSGKIGLHFQVLGRR